MRQEEKAKRMEVPRPAKILIVEDEPAMVSGLRDNFEFEGYEVITARDGAEGLQSALDESPDLVVLDVMMPRMSGLEVCKQLRAKRASIPIIMLTARGQEVDKVVGLELGADDYIAKPFGLRELLARIRAVLRRREVGRAALQRDSKRGCSRFGGWRLDRRARRLTNPDGAPVALTKGEYALLIAFLDAPQRPLSREHLLQATRVHEDVFDRSIVVQVLRLRRKLEIDPTAPKVIRTERGVGYVFALAVQPG